jgi:hypothetical protein
VVQSVVPEFKPSIAKKKKKKEVKMKIRAVKES